MLPIAPMMIEHRLIERMIHVIAAEIRRIEATQQVNPRFIEEAVDFIRVYADQTHHGKEEEILFRELKKKTLQAEHLQIMEDLLADHVFGRKTTAALVSAMEKYVAGDITQLDAILDHLRTLVQFYPVHIAKEDKQFFVPVMAYFTPEEQQAQLEEGYAYDRKMIHRRYLHLVETAERSRNLFSPSPTKWLDYL